MAWDFFAHTRTLELLYHKMQAPVLEEYHLTQIELDVLLFLSHHVGQDHQFPAMFFPLLNT